MRVVLLAKAFSHKKKIFYFLTKVEGFLGVLQFPPRVKVTVPIPLKKPGKSLNLKIKSGLKSRYKIVISIFFVWAGNEMCIKLMYCDCACCYDSRFGCLFFIAHV